MEHDTKTEGNLEKAWQKLSESFIPRENLIPSDTFGDDDIEEDPAVEAKRRYVDGIDDIQFFIKNILFELDDEMDDSRDLVTGDRTYHLWQNVAHMLKEYSTKLESAKAGQPPKRIPR